MPAVKTTTWTGATNSNFDTATNWSNGVPLSADTAIIDGAVSITGGSVTNEVISRFYVAFTYTGAIGTSGTPLEIDVAQMSYDSNTSSSTSYIHIKGSTNTTPDVIIDGLKTGSALTLSGTIDRLLVESTFAGILTLGNGGSFVAIPNDFIMKSTNGTVTAPNSAEIAWATGAKIYISAGSVTIAENFGQNAVVILSGGTINVNTWTVASGDSLTILGGTCNWNAGDKSFTTSGTAVNTIHSLNIIEGTFTLASNDNARVGFSNIVQWGGTVNLESSYANINIDGTYERFGGTYIPPKQSTIATAKL